MKTNLRLMGLVNQAAGRDGPLGRPISISARPAVAPYQLWQAILRASIMRSQTASWVVASLMLALLGGCLEEHLVWSPDGKTAAVIAKDGLHFCDAEGRLTPPLLSGVYAVAWLGDGQRVVVARAHVAEGWADVAQALGPERAAQVTAQAADVWTKLGAGSPWGVLTMELGKKNAQSVMRVFLRERYGEALRAKITSGDWDEVKSAQVEINELLTARIEGATVRPGPVLHEGVEKIEALRVSPGDQAIAFTTDLTPDNDKECRLWLTRVDVAGATTVAERTAAYPDWTPDARSLVYLQAAEGGEKGDLRLATLVRREVLDASGQIKLQEKPDDLAGMVFSNLSRVRCLRDGRILFNAVEFSL